MSSAAPVNEPFRAAVGQLEAGPGLEENLAAIERHARLASARGARLVLLPEAAVLPIQASAPELADAAAAYAAIRERLAGIAAGARVAIVAGLFEPSGETGRVFNTVVAHADDGADLGAYRKIHLYDALGATESDRFAPGPLTPLTFAFGGLRFGILTCYDLRFPELARALVDDGAEVLLVPAAWASGPLKEDHWSVLLRARAIESTAYVLGAGQCGARHAGCSAIVDPFGVALAGLGEQAGVAVADLSGERLADVRRRLPVLANRRLGAAPQTGPTDIL